MCVKSSLPISEPPCFCLVQIEGVSNTEIELHPVMETSLHNGAVSSNEPVVCVWRGGGGGGGGVGASLHLQVCVHVLGMCMTFDKLVSTCVLCVWGLWGLACVFTKQVCVHPCVPVCLCVRARVCLSLY